MAVSEEKMRIVINNYFKSECNVDTSIREAFEKGFRIGVEKGQLTSPGKETERKTGKWILSQDVEYEYCTCSECGYDNGENWMIGSKIPYCEMCGSYNGGKDDV